MKAILIDDEKMAMELFEYNAKNIDGLEIAAKFTNGEEAVEYVKNNAVDIVVLDVNMAESDGIVLGKYLKKLKPDIALIFATGYEQYAIDAVRLHAAGYLLKPFSRREIEYAVESARLLAKRPEKKIRVKTFGHFDIFVNGRPVMFKSAKAKELLALLIDRRGGIVTTDQIISTLWENRPNNESTQNLCSKITKTLKRELDNNKIGEILISSRGSRRVDTDKIECDLFRLIDGDPQAKHSFIGEYMTDYGWGENTVAMLNKLL